MKKTVLNAFYYHGRDLVSDIRPVNAISVDGIFPRSNPGREEEKRILSARKYYRVTAKCGHVGRNRFLKGEFYVRAEDKKEAAAKARLFPRVKHDHKDAILKSKKSRATNSWGEKPRERRVRIGHAKVGASRRSSWRT